MLFLFDKATNSVTSFIKVITTKQAEVAAYVKDTYSQASVTIEGTWMRLDFNEDGKVSADDLKSSLVGLYEFLRHFDVIETTTHIKGQLYNDAIRYMQAELRSEENKRQERELASPKSPQDSNRLDSDQAELVNVDNFDLKKEQ